MTIICMHMLRLFAPQLDALGYIREKAGPPRIDLYFYPPPPVVSLQSSSSFTLFIHRLHYNPFCFLLPSAALFHSSCSQVPEPVDTATEGRIDSLHVE